MEQEASQDMPLLTFNSLYNLLREEKRMKKLQEVPDLFYEAIDELIANKKNDVETFKQQGEISKASRERHIIKKSNEIITEILNIRAMKISNIAIKNELFGSETLSKDNIVGKEVEFYDIVKKGTKKINKRNK